MARIERVPNVVAALLRRRGRYGSPQVRVGYAQSYAVHVHEDLNARHVTGEAKFLERPAREMAKMLGRMVRDAVRAGTPLVRALYAAGLRLQRESQSRCPVKTGALRASAFTKVETQ